MKNIRLYLLLFLLPPGLSAQTPGSLPSDGFFDPERDAVAKFFGGTLRLAVREDVLVRACRSSLARVGFIERVDRQQFGDDWYLVLQSRHAADIEQSVFVALRLRQGADGYYYADHFWHACTGNSCGGCGWDELRKNCFCMFDKPGEPGTPGFCYHTVSTDPLLHKVPLRE